MRDVTYDKHFLEKSRKQLKIEHRQIGSFHGWLWPETAMASLLSNNDPH
jgi:hypothetical protein